MTNVLEYLEIAVRDYGDRIALEDGERSITYKQLGYAARKIGEMISKNGPTGETMPVGVYATRDIYTPILYMGVLYSGNFYVPMDKDMPQEKRENIIAQSGMELILDAEDVKELVDALPNTDDIAQEDICRMSGEHK